MRRYLLFIFSCSFLLSLFLSCKKPVEVNPDQPLSFSSDSVFFDTLFTSLLSISKKIIVYNKSDRSLTIDKIEVDGGTLSPFKTIINGATTNSRESVLIERGDSIFILVSVKIDPADTIKNLFLVSDAISFRVRDKVQRVSLTAYGSNAIFLNNQTLSCSTNWTSSKPYVIYNTVTVQEGCTLTVDKGAKIYFHENALLKVNGTLIINGSKDSTVLLSGDNLRKGFEELVGQWNGIEISKASKNNKIAYAIIKNAKTGILAEEEPDSDTIPEITIANTVIKNMSVSGIEAYGADIYIHNSLITNCVVNAFAGLGGGNYYLDYNTFANYSYDFFREDSTLYFSDYSHTKDGTLISGPLNAKLRNCIVWGSSQNEVRIVYKEATSNISAYHSLLKTSRQQFSGNGNLLNVDPKFIWPAQKNFRLDSLSPAIGWGMPILGIDIDLDGKSRLSAPDLGAYQR